MFSSLLKPQILINFYSKSCMILMVSINLTSWITKDWIIFIDFCCWFLILPFDSPLDPPFFSSSFFGSFSGFFCHWSTFKYWSIYCALGPTLAASITHVHFPTQHKKHAEHRTLPTAALSSCGFGSLKRETWETTSGFLVVVSVIMNDGGHLSWVGTCPRIETHLCFT